MEALTQKGLIALKETFDNYHTGIYIEPYGIDVCEKRYVIYDRVEIGGMRGGSCWGDKPYSYTSDESTNFDTLGGIVEELCPDISYKKFKEIEKLVRSNTDTEYEYYGNETEYLIQWVALDDVCDILGIKREYKNELYNKYLSEDRD